MTKKKPIISENAVKFRVGKFNHEALGIRAHTVEEFKNGEWQTYHSGGRPLVMLKKQEAVAVAALLKSGSISVLPEVIKRVPEGTSPTAALHNLKEGESVILTFKHKTNPYQIAKQVGISIRTEMLDAKPGAIRIKCTRIRRKK